MENKYEFFIAGRTRNKENILKICDLFDKYNISYYFIISKPIFYGGNRLVKCSLCHCHIDLYLQQTKRDHVTI